MKRIYKSRELIKMPAGAIARSILSLLFEILLMFLMKIGGKLLLQIDKVERSTFFHKNHKSITRILGGSISYHGNKLLPFLVALCLLFTISIAFGQTANDYRTKASGNWNDSQTWERYNGSAWENIQTYAYPNVAGTATSTKTTTSGTSHTVALPSGISSGDLLLIFWADANTNTTVTIPTGWTELYNSITGNRRYLCMYIIATGSEGSSVSVTTSGGERSAHTSYRIAAETYQGVPVSTTAATGSGSTPNPPNLTSGFGATNTLWIAASHSGGDDNSPTPTGPADFTNLITGYTGSSNTNHARMATATRELSSTNTDPGTFSLGSNVNWAANTIAIQSVPVVGAIPSSSVGVITIRNGHTVTVDAASNADQCIIEVGGQVTVNTGQTWTIANGTGTDLTVNGTVSNAGTMTMTGTTVFNSGAIYEHAQNGGTIPTASWDAASTCNITGLTTTAMTGQNQTFGNFTWNCASQTDNIALEPNGMSVAGNLTITSTNSGSLIMAGTAGIDRSLAVSGNFSQTGGTLNMSSNSGIGTLNIAGDFSHTSGTITETSTGSGAIVFDKSGVQTYTSGGTVSNTINFTVNSGSALHMASESTTVTGGGTFTLSSGATLGITSTSGITSSDASGNIQVSGTRTFSTGANYTYLNTDAQVTGNGLPSAVNNLTTNTGGLLQSESGSSANLLTDNYTNLTNWTGAIGTGNNQFTTVATANAGGTANEARYFYGSSATTFYTASIYRSINTTGYTGLNIQWKQFIDNYNSTSYPYTIKAQCATSSSGPWTDMYTLSPTGSANIGPDINQVQGWTTNVGGTFFIRFYIEGYTYGLDYWYFDDLIIDGYSTAASTVTVNGTLALNNGTYEIGSNNLVLTAGVSGSNAIIGGTTSNLTVGGASANLTLPIITNGLNNFTLTRPNGAIINSNLTLAGNASIEGSASLSLASIMSIAGNLSVDASASFVVEADKALTVDGTITNSAGNAGLVLKSTTTGTASLIHNTNNVPATVERYITGAAEAWHFLSSPVSGQGIIGSWIPSGTYGNGTGYDLYVWDEPTPCWVYHLNSTVSPTWDSIHSSSNFVVGKGYLYSVQAANPTKTFAGNLNNGAQNMPVTNNSLDLDLQGFNLIGNPYPSSIDWRASSGWTRTNLLETGGGYDLWLWNPAANNYGVINSAGVGAGTNGVTQYIAPMQGFFVRAASNGNVSMTNAIRLHEGASLWMSPPPHSLKNKIKVRIESLEGFGYDEVLLQFGFPGNEPGATKLFSHEQHAPSAYLHHKNKDYSVGYYSTTKENPVVPLMFKPGRNGLFNLSIVYDYEEFGSLLLEDKKTGKFHDLTKIPYYQFQATTKDAAERFAIHFSPPGDILREKLPARIYYEGDDIVVDLAEVETATDIKIMDVLGRVILKTKVNGGSIHRFPMNTKNQALIVNASSEKRFTTEKVFIF